MSVFAKCGVIVRYCLTGAGDVSAWRDIEREDMFRRVELAVKAVYRILGVPLNPVVEILDELDNDTAGGLCCDGGKRILFKYSCCLGISWMLDAILHECFHALQAHLKSGHYAQWYYDNMGITYGRVSEWIETRKQAFDHNTQSNMYKVHMYEADARAFEADCRRARDEYWSAVDFE